MLLFRRKRSGVLWAFVILAGFCLCSSPVLAGSKRIARFEDERGDIRYGLVEGDRVQPVQGGTKDFAVGRFQKAGAPLELSRVKLLAPVVPSKVINFGWTYPEHAREVGGEARRKEPLMFLKPPSVIVADGEPVIYPRELSERVEYEGELAIVIGKRAKQVAAKDALSYVLGYTCFNDVTARDLTKKDPQFTRGKGFDTFGPLGPWIVTGINPSRRHIVTRLNGAVVQDASTSQMTFSIPFLISFASQVMTLEPGDVIATGTPGGSGPMRPGDVVEVEIDGIGKLTNSVR